MSDLLCFSLQRKLAQRKIKDTFGNISHTQYGVFQCDGYKIIVDFIPVFMTKKFYKWIIFQDNHVFKLHATITVKDFRIQLEGMEQVKERGHITFKTLTIFG